MGTAPLQLRLLGTAELRAGEQNVVLPTRKLLGLLAYLAVEGPTDRSRLAGLLWEATEERARANLRGELYRLRRTSGANVVEEQQGTVRLSGVAIDLAELRRAAEAQDWKRAVALDGGPLLSGFALKEAPAYEEWLGDARARHERERTRLFNLHARELENAGELREALAVHQRLLDTDWLVEEAHRAVMRLHARLGEHPLALAWYARLQERLRRELGTDPADETRALAAELRAGVREPEKRPATVAPPGHETLWERLRELTRTGQLVVLRGPAGGPQSRLAMEFITTQGFRLGLLEGKHGDHATPFATATRLVRRLLEFRPVFTLDALTRREVTRLLPELGETPPPCAPEEQLDVLTRYLLQMMPRGFAKLADGIHHFDPKSLEVVLYENALSQRDAEPCPHLATFEDGALPAPNEVLLSQHLERGLGTIVTI